MKMGRTLCSKEVSQANNIATGPEFGSIAHALSLLDWKKTTGACAKSVYSRELCHWAITIIHSIIETSFCIDIRHQTNTAMNFEPKLPSVCFKVENFADLLFETLFSWQRSPIHVRSHSFRGKNALINEILLTMRFVARV